MNSVSRTTASAPKKGNLKTGKGHFAAAFQRLAKLRDKNSHLQHGNTKTKKAFVKGKAKADSSIVARGKGLGAQPTDGQLGLNPRQQGGVKDDGDFDDE